MDVRLQTARVRQVISPSGCAAGLGHQFLEAHGVAIAATCVPDTDVNDRSSPTFERSSRCRKNTGVSWFRKVVRRRGAVGWGV